MKNLLLCVVGTTPQIITETIYSLSLKKINIDELVVITTSLGAKKIKESLIDKGILKRLISDYNLPQIKFPPQNIHIIKSDDNRELSDIRTTIDNESAGDLIYRIVKGLTSDDNSILHCSLAGGRKTMGFYLGTALQLYGRRDDKLYHVLVSEEFESNPDFFYPPPKSVSLAKKLGKRKKTLNTDKAKIELVELSFIRLRKFIDFQDKPLKDLILYTQKELDTLRRLQPLEFINNGDLKIGNKEIKLHTSLWKFYLQFAKIKKEKCPNPQRIICENCDDCFLPMKSDEKGKIKEGLYDLIKNKDEGDIRILISKVNKNLKQQLLSSKIDVTPYLITPLGSYRKRYGLLIDKSKIIFSEV